MQVNRLLSNVAYEYPGPQCRENVYAYVHPNPPYNKHLDLESKRPLLASKLSSPARKCTGMKHKKCCQAPSPAASWFGNGLIRLGGSNYVTSALGGLHRFEKHSNDMQRSSLTHTNKGFCHLELWTEEKLRPE